MAVLVLVIVISLLLITVGEYSQYYTKDGRHGTGGKDGLCLSQECISVAATILSDIDPTVEPCKDFYKVRKEPLISQTFICTYSTK